MSVKEGIEFVEDSKARRGRWTGGTHFPGLASTVGNLTAATGRVEPAG